MGQVLKELTNTASFFEGLKIPDALKNVQCLMEEYREQVAVR